MSVIKIYQVNNYGPFLIYYKLILPGPLHELNADILHVVSQLNCNVHMNWVIFVTITIMWLHAEMQSVMISLIPPLSPCHDQLNND